jgi:hypothetical protein
MFYFCAGSRFGAKPQLHGWGGADMLNLFDPSGRKLTSIAEKRRPIAPRSQTSARTMGARKVIPFSPDLDSRTGFPHGEWQKCWRLIKPGQKCGAKL